eukprot:TRINITY_DN6061_c0_g1_i2.p1 TRINITY_DN6061_c0_g1~~TRINITY_DN6061_c0_g1_i2.p1  ORF type:complete len:182 (-),score=47.95 TRINITY_DN6061_c0_g1_i2:313-858(-)
MEESNESLIGSGETQTTSGGDFSSWLDRAEENYSKSSENKRHQIFQLPSPAFSEDQPDEDYTRLAQIFFSAAPIYTSKSDKVVLEDFLFGFLKAKPDQVKEAGFQQHQKKFLKAFLASLTKAVSFLKGQSGKPAQCHKVTLTRWSCIALLSCLDLALEASNKLFFCSCQSSNNTLDIFGRK